MSRFDCPSCEKSLRLRLLAHVPRSTGEFAFSCPHCGAVLVYNETALETLFWGTRVRRVLTFLGGMALLSGISLVAGRTVALATLAALVVTLGAAYLLSPRAAYKIAAAEPRREG